MSITSEYLWYIPNQSQVGHRGDIAAADHNSLDTLWWAMNSDGI